MQQPGADWGIPISQELPAATGRLAVRSRARIGTIRRGRGFSIHHLGRAAANDTIYDAGLWERTHLIYGLDRIGKLTPTARVLVTATLPDAVIAALSEYVGRVDVLDLTQASARRGAEARLYWSNGALYARDRLFVHEPATQLDGLVIGPTMRSSARIVRCSFGGRSGLPVYLPRSNG